MSRRVPASSSRSRPRRSTFSSSSFGDLITHTEKTISSQATVYENSQRILSTQQRTAAYEDLDEALNEQLDVVTITAEEEREIQCILQLARNGKINAKNAFELPVHVLNPMLTENWNTRFWKFASQLLSASSKIYDKRVDNTYDNAHSMEGKLLLIFSKKGSEEREGESEEQQDKHNRRRKGEILSMSIEDFTNWQAGGALAGGEATLVEPDKIDIKNQRQQFIADPLMQQKLKVFDSDSLKSLFLNTFECNHRLQLRLFNESSRDEAHAPPILTSSQLTEQLKTEVGKCSLVLRSSNLFGNISTFKKELVGIQLKQPSRGESAEFDLSEGEFRDLFKEFNLSVCDEQMSVALTEDAPSSHDFNVDNEVTLSEANSASLAVRPSKGLFDLSPFSIQSYHLSYGDSESVMNPWELEAKGFTRTKRAPRGITARERPKKEELSLSIKFQPFLLKRKDVLVPETVAQSPRKGQPVDKFLLPKQMDVYGLFQHRDVYGLFHHDLGRLNTFAYGQEDAARGVFDDCDEQTNIYKKQEEQNEATRQQEQIEEERQEVVVGVPYLEPPISEGTANYRTYGIRSIRQVKELIFEQIKQKGEVRLTELNLGLSISSLMVIFLHLANERELVIHELAGGLDILLALQ